MTPTILIPASDDFASSAFILQNYTAFLTASYITVIVYIYFIFSLALELII